MASMADLPQGYNGQGAAPSFDINTQGGLGFLNATLTAGNAGRRTTPGVAAFMPEGWNLGSLSGPGGMDGDQHMDNGTAPQDIIGLANKYGFDTSKYNLQDTSDLASADYDGRSRANGLNVPKSNGVGQLYNDLNASDIGKYERIGGLSGGWDGTALADRGASSTLYRNDNGVYTPAQASGHYKAITDPGWIKGEGADLVAAASIIGGGMLGGSALAGAAGAGGGAAGAGGAAAGAGGGAAAAGGGTAGFYGSVANALGLGSQWGALSPLAQGAIGGALQGGVTSGITGGNPLTGALMGGLGGGLSAGGAGMLSGATGLPEWASRAAIGAGMGGLNGAVSGGNPLIGALGGGVSSLGSTALSELGLPSGLANLGGKLGSGLLTGLANGSGTPAAGATAGRSGAGLLGGAGGSAGASTGSDIGSSNRASIMGMLRPSARAGDTKVEDVYKLRRALSEVT